MGFVINHGAANAALGESLGAVGAGLLAGQRNRREQQRADIEVQAAKQLLAERAEKRQAENELATGQAAAIQGDMGRTERVNRAGVADKAMGAVNGFKVPSIEDATQGLVLQEELDQDKSLAESMSSPLAKSMFLQDRQEAYHGRVVDRQEKHAIGELSRTIAAISQTAPPGAEEFVPRYQQLGQLFDMAKQSPAKERAALIEQGMTLKAKLDTEYAGFIKETAQRQNSLEYFQGLLGGIENKDSDDYHATSDAIAGLMLGGKPADVLKAYQLGRAGVVEVSPGVYVNKATAAFMAQQAATQQRGNEATANDATRARLGDQSDATRNRLGDQTDATRNRLGDQGDATRNRLGDQSNATRLEISDDANETRRNSGSSRTSQDVNARAKLIVESSRPVVDRFSGSKGDPTISLADATQQARREIAEENGRAAVDTTKPDRAALLDELKAAVGDRAKLEAAFKKYGVDPDSLTAEEIKAIRGD